MNKEMFKKIVSVEEQLDVILSGDKSALEIEKENNNVKVYFTFLNMKEELDLESINDFVKELNNVDRVLKNANIEIKKNNNSNYNTTLKVVDFNNITWFKVLSNSILDALKLTNVYLENLD